MKQQTTVRTYPKNFTNATTPLHQALNNGWVVVMSNPFDCGNGQQGTEYILEKDVDRDG
ncbi:5,10-methylenetetrahydrofolate reductase [Oceanobacillus picturae]|uniref:5,10-methylenetetrahydrofolate reductase n=1 Tax=Oceanobacillus picturae TaxID=171693 RepID=A0A0U9HE20_9BACI|nr:hypothetical protein [Oceanobacillus picturae]GAQ18006.1 5,10-methylenetetrahydrofolate reductase [Oceanobacillus picturae]